jgi:hypothetical protein
VKKIITAVVAAGLALGLTACSEPPNSGTVYKKPYSPAGAWYSTECGQYVTVTKTRVRTSYDGKSSRVETYTDTTCVMYVHRAHPTPPSWSLCLRADDDPKHEGCFDVPESIWNRYEVGSHYPDPR